MKVFSMIGNLSIERISTYLVMREHKKIGKKTEIS